MASKMLTDLALSLAPLQSSFAPAPIGRALSKWFAGGSRTSRSAAFHERDLSMSQSHAPLRLLVQRLCFETVFLADGRVSHNWGPTLRGGFGKTLRHISCTSSDRSCRGCPANSTCAYAYLFETPVPAGAAVMRKYPHAPHPFVFEPGEQNFHGVSKGLSVQHSLVVVGKAIQYLPHIFLALNHLGQAGLGAERVPYQITRVTDESGTVLLEPGHARFEAARCRQLVVEPGPSRNRVFTVSLATPTRLVADGRLTRRPTMLDLVKAVSRRLFLINYFHGNGLPLPASEAFLEAARETRCLRVDLAWQEDRRYSTRQKRQVPIGGIVGTLTFEGDFGLLEPLLRAAEYVHVGKNATFGLGRIHVREGA